MSDSINCQFYTKMGACRHGEKCSRKHVRPTHSKTIMMANLYQNPEVERPVRRRRRHNPEGEEGGEEHHQEQPETQPVAAEAVPKAEVEKRFEAFFKDIFAESALLGEVVELTVCENHNDHLNGNVYVKFRSDGDAQRARDNFSTRWYNGRPVYCELSPVSDFRDAICRQHDTQSCERGGMCNFMHVKRPPRELLKVMRLSQRKYQQEKALK